MTPPEGPSRSRNTRDAATVPCAPQWWRGEDVPRLVLGTAQLGMAYGIANVHGRPNMARARAIIETAWNGGIRHFDTAQAYGHSEEVLGHALGALGLCGEARVITKLAATMNPRDVPAIAASIEDSKQRLGVARLWAVMLHTPQWLDHWDAGLGELLLRLQRAGGIAHLGVSMSPPEDGPRCLAHPDLTIIQAPCNAWDRRLVNAGFFQQARARDKLACVRSVYLQGLLTLSPSAVSEKLPAARAAAERWHTLAAQWESPPTALALRFALTLNAPLVIGAETPEQIKQTLLLAQAPPLTHDQCAELAASLDPVVTPTILEPWRWPA